MKNTLVKICGITNPSDALWAANLGTDFIGINFVTESPRKISVEKAAETVQGLPPFVKAVGVFVNPELVVVQKILKKVSLHILQFHGSQTKEDLLRFKQETRLPIWKAVSIENESSLHSLADLKDGADVFLLDAYHPELSGGTGQTFDWDLAVKAKECGKPIILSGGLNPDNVSDAVKKVLPYAVDTASGVEKDTHPRKKDIEKMKRFILNAK